MDNLSESEKKERLRRALDKAKKAEEAAQKEARKQVMLKGAVDLETKADYVVSVSYTDITLIIAMLRDYVGLCDEIQGNDFRYQAYFRRKFLGIADSLSEQIGYDYDEALKKCRSRQDDDADVGGDALEMAMKKRRRA